MNVPHVWGKGKWKRREPDTISVGKLRYQYFRSISMVVKGVSKVI